MTASSSGCLPCLQPSPSQAQVLQRVRVGGCTRQRALWVGARGSVRSPLCSHHTHTAAIVLAQAPPHAAVLAPTISAGAGPSAGGSGAGRLEDELAITLTKALSHTSPAYKRIGILGTLAVLRQQVCTGLLLCTLLASCCCAHSAASCCCAPWGCPLPGWQGQTWASLLRVGRVTRGASLLQVLDWLAAREGTAAQEEAEISGGEGQGGQHAQAWLPWLMAWLLEGTAAG